RIRSSNSSATNMPSPADGRSPWSSGSAAARRRYRLQRSRSDAAMIASSVHYRVAAVQMVSGADVAANLAQAELLIADAAEQGAKLILLPENFGFMGLHANDKIAIRERDGDGIQQAFLSTTARRHRVVLIGGSVPIACDDPARIKQALLVYGPDGVRLAR